MALVGRFPQKPQAFGRAFAYSPLAVQEKKTEGILCLREILPDGEPEPLGCLEEVFLHSIPVVVSHAQIEPRRKGLGRYRLRKQGYAFLGILLEETGQAFEV